MADLKGKDLEKKLLELMSNPKNHDRMGQLMMKRMREDLSVLPLARQLTTCCEKQIHEIKEVLRENIYGKDELSEPA